MKREVRAGGDAGIQLIADERRELEDRPTLRRGAEIPFVGDALLIEGEHIGHERPGVDDGDCRIAGAACRQPAERVAQHVGASSMLSRDSCNSMRRRKPPCMSSR